MHQKACKGRRGRRFETDWVSGRAVISARGVTKANHLTIVIEDVYGWRKVEKFVERWMKEFKREILVRLTGTWRKKNVFVDVDDEQETGKPKATVRKLVFIC